MELSTFTGPMLALAGVVFQFAIRQFARIHWIVYWLAVVALCGFVYWLTNPVPLAGGTKFAIATFLLWMAGASGTVRGFSSVTDAVAKNAIKSNPNLAASLMVPVTNSM